ncbi:hypothetical protein OROGR_029074 [Orobanche gracilis]
MVYEQHILLGLIAEDRSPRGFLESGITIDVAREAVQSFSPGDYRSARNGGVSGNQRFRKRICRFPGARSVFLRLQLIIRRLWGISS